MTEEKLQLANNLKSRIKKLDMFLEVSSIEYIKEEEGDNDNDKVSLWEKMLCFLPFHFHTKYADNTLYNPYELEADKDLIEAIRKVCKEHRDKYQRQLNDL